MFDAKPHVFLDLETLCKKPSAVFFQIGAVEFNPRTFELGRTLDLELSADDQVLHGRTVDDGTVEWHAEHGRTIQMAEGLDMRAGLARFCEWLAEIEPERVWIWGPDFDRPILEHAFASIGLELPWPYHRTMDARTVWNLAFPYEKRPSRPHSAFNDCVAAINDLRRALEKLGLVERDLCDVG